MTSHGQWSKMSNGNFFQVTEIRLKYFDTVPVSTSMCVLKTGFLFVASEFGNQWVYNRKKWYNDIICAQYLFEWEFSLLVPLKFQHVYSEVNVQYADWEFVFCFKKGHIVLSCAHPSVHLFVSYTSQTFHQASFPPSKNS